MRAAAPPPAWRTWVRRHERTLAACWLAVVGALLVLLAAPPTRRVLLGAVQATVDRWDARWTARLARGEMLVASGRYAQAEVFLARLDRVFPARNARHVRGRDRERLLALLAASHEALGHTTRAMAVYDRLVAFDSLNYANHYLRAAAAERMLSGWAVSAVAGEGYAGVLRVYPSHLPSVRGLIQYHADRSEWRPIVDAYRAYLDAFLVQVVSVTVGDTTVAVPLPVDGRPHPVVVDVAASGARALSLHANGLAFALDSATVTPAVRVGRAVTATVVPLRPETAALRGMTRTASGAFLPETDAAAVDLALPAAPGGAARVRLVVRLFKPVDRAVWRVAAMSRRNLLDPEGLAADAARTVAFADPARADAALARLPNVGSGPAPAGVAAR